MARERSLFEVIHPGAFERPVGYIEARGLDEIDPDPETGGHAQDRAGIARNSRLVKGNAQVGFVFNHNRWAPLAIFRSGARIS